MRLGWRGMLGKGRRRLLSGLRIWFLPRGLRSAYELRQRQRSTARIGCATVFRTLLFLEKCGRVVVTSKWCLRQGARPA